MRILVTGGTGMLGRAILRLYAARHTLRFTGRKRALGESLAAATGADFHAVALHDAAGLDAACSGMDAVIHCAALSSPWGPRAAFDATNVRGTAALLAAAERAGVARFVHVSTPSLYFRWADGLQIPESPLPPGPCCNAYAASKALAEERVLASALHTVILRPRAIFGPHDAAILPRVIRAVRGRTLLLPSGRNPLVDLTYVDNVADAALLAATRPDLPRGAVYNITNGEPRPILDLLADLFAALGSDVRIRTLPYPLLRPVIAASEWLHVRLPGQPEPRLTRYSAGLFHYHQTLDISRARAELGYVPAVSIAEGITRYVRWYQHAAV